MKVLKDNFNTTIHEAIKETNHYPRKHICDNCSSELEYEESDLKMGVLGCMNLKCPLCGYNNLIEDNEHNVTLTKDNVEFPVHFFHTSKEDGAVDVCNNEYVKKCIKESINNLRRNKNEFYHFTGTGNTMVFVFRFDGDEEYNIIVTNNYYETYIPFEEEDYEL